MLNYLLAIWNYKRMKYNYYLKNKQILSIKLEHNRNFKLIKCHNEKVKIRKIMISN